MARVSVVRDPKSTYRGPFLVDYFTTDGGSADNPSAKAFEDYVYTTGTIYVEQDQENAEIVITTLADGGVTINGIDVQISGLEGAEFFNLSLRNLRACDGDGEESFPYRCVPEFFITDGYPSGIPSTSEPDVTMPILLTDKIATAPVELPDADCPLNDVISILRCNNDQDVLTVDEVIATGEIVLLEVFNRRTGDLIGTVNYNDLPAPVDVTGQFTENATLEILYRACGCCLEKTYACICEIVEIRGELECCEIVDVLGDLVCCEITQIQGTMSCAG